MNSDYGLCFAGGPLRVTSWMKTTDSNCQTETISIRRQTHKVPTLE